MDIFFALAAPPRRHIMEILSRQGQQSATAIADRFDVSPAAISQHLKVLRETGLIQVEKQGQRRLYEIDPAALLELDAWSKKIASEWHGRLGRLDVLLKRNGKNKKG